MTREEQLACLKDRPCNVCKMRTDKGCSSWECVFEQTPDEEKNICNRCQHQIVCKFEDISAVVKCAEYLEIKKSDFEKCLPISEIDRDYIKFPKGSLKKRDKDYVVYNYAWLKENWQTELKVMGIEPSIQPKPMQVDLEGDGYADGELVYDYGKCPKCGWEFEYGEKDWEEPYCCHCGQKLHWFESEDKE